MSVSLVWLSSERSADTRAGVQHQTVDGGDCAADEGRCLGIDIVPEIVKWSELPMGAWRDTVTVLSEVFVKTKSRHDFGRDRYRWVAKCTCCCSW